MRTGWILRSDLSVDQLVDEACRADRLGIDVLWLDHASDESYGSTLVTAAFLSAIIPSIRIAAVVDVGPHPVSIAEQAGVADLALGGRLTLVVRCGDDEIDLLDETVGVLLLAFASRPFRHHGRRWTIPAQSEANTGWIEDRIIVTPTPSQLDLPIWIVGPCCQAVAAEHGLAFVSDSPVDAGDSTSRSRPAIVSLRGSDPVAAAGAAVNSLREAQRRWGMDLAVFDAESSDKAARLATIEHITHEVRPRVQMDRLPPGIEGFWDADRSLIGC